MNRDFTVSCFSTQQNQCIVSSNRFHASCRLTVIGDYHCTMADFRDDEYQECYKRMSQYGNRNMENLKAQLCEAQGKSDIILLAGDMISYPTLKNIETLSSLIRDSKIPCLFTAGNHDWHFEGTSGSDQEQRAEWIRKRLLALYDGKNPLFYSCCIKGIKIVVIDNSIYEILPEQLDFVKEELKGPDPVLVCMHIPMYLPVPGRDSVTGFGCGNPDWCGAKDPYWQIERRQRWSDAGQRAETAEFCDLLTHADSVIGIIAGHTHRCSFDFFNNRFQLVVSSKEPHELELRPYTVSGMISC